jgi:hypothetical protein
LLKYFVGLLFCFVFSFSFLLFFFKRKSFLLKEKNKMSSVCSLSADAGRAMNDSLQSRDNNILEQLFEDDDVQRYDADAYRIKYGDKWKQFASSVRDIPQPDGTIIREYVIEDPSLLEQLSEDDEITLKPTTNHELYHFNPIASANEDNSKSTGFNDDSKEKEFTLSSGGAQIEKYFQPISNQSNGANVGVPRTTISKAAEDEVDKELEIIHEQGNR